MKRLVGLALVMSALAFHSMSVLAAPEAGWTCPAGVCVNYEDCNGHGTCWGDETCTYQECPNHGAAVTDREEHHRESCSRSDSGQGHHHGRGQGHKRGRHH